jgi:phosphopantothenoylcysteine decarboxylase/phosphopantothenate--cysteine ligase
MERRTNYSDIYFVVTSGPTREYLDPVRYISNPSSGKMGFYLASECLKLSPNLIYIHGPILPQFIPSSGQSIAIESAQELMDVMLSQMRNLKNKKIILFMAAAPGDYKVKKISGRKIKKTGHELVLRLVENPDILKKIDKLCGKYPTFFRAGFAAESHNLSLNGQKKLKGKNLDLIIINNIKRTDVGFQSDDNEVILFFADGERLTFEKSHKQKIARQILKKVLNKIPWI